MKKIFGANFIFQPDMGSIGDSISVNGAPVAANAPAGVGVVKDLVGETVKIRFEKFLLE